MIVIEIYADNTYYFPHHFFFFFFLIFSALAFTSIPNQMMVVYLYAVDNWWGKRVVPGT